MLGGSEAPSFRSPHDVVLAAEAFSVHFHRILAHPPNRPESPGSGLDPRDLLAGEQLTRSLCWLGSGPFGIGHDAVRLVAELAPLYPDAVVETVAQGGPSAQMIRALDSSLRHSPTNAHVRRVIHDLLASPPERIFRRVPWIRALRGMRRSDFLLDEHQRPSRTWLYDQLRFAMSGELGYVGARAHERRYALWCLAELTNDDSRWKKIATSASEDPALDDLILDAEQLRAALKPGRQPDSFLFTPKDGWRLPTALADVDEILDPRRARTANWSQADSWSWMRPSTREPIVALLRDALLGPCAIRQRSAIDGLRSSSALARESATVSVGAVMSSIGSNPSRADILERCLIALGSLGQRRSIRIVEDVVQSTKSDQILAQAIVTAGDLVHVYPRDCVGLTAWVQAQSSRTESPEVAAAGAHFAVIARRDASSFVPDGLKSRPGVAEVLAWAARVASDPLLPPQPAI
jgi:hypothetical protein